MTNAEKFIDLVTKLYNLPEKTISTMTANVPEIDAELSKYYWDDIKTKTQLYFSRKNDKTRPTIAQILALLETDPNVKQRESEPVYDTPAYKLPTTHLFSIATTFNKLVKVLVDAGVIPDEHGDYHNNRSLVDPKTDEVILNPWNWLKWELAIAENERPNVFVSVPAKTTLEKLALAIQNNLITFKVRDWAKLTKNVGGTK